MFSNYTFITFISEYKNDSNTHRFEINKNTFIDNESSKNYKMSNTKYHKIRMQSIVFVALRIPNDKTEVALTKTTMKEINSNRTTFVLRAQHSITVKAGLVFIFVEWVASQTINYKNFRLSMATVLSIQTNQIHQHLRGLFGFPPIFGRFNLSSSLASTANTLKVLYSVLF